jgi:biopolymer transport protein ExbB
MAVWQLIKIGGFTMDILLLCSVLSLAAIIERLIFYHRRSRIKRVEFMEKVKKEIQSGNIRKAVEVCRKYEAPFSNVVYAGLTLQGSESSLISNAMERATTIETAKLEKHTTLLGIIRAFHDISSANSGGLSAVINGISEALVCTAAGLIVAVPAVIAYNYFAKRIDTFVTEMELCASETLDLITH